MIGEYTEKEIKEFEKLYNKFLNKGGKIRNAAAQDYQSGFKKYVKAFENEKMVYPNLSKTRINNIILKSVSYNENYDPQEASVTSFTKEINKMLRKNKIYIREIKELEKNGKKYKKSVFASLKTNDIKYIESGKTKSGANYRAYKVYNNGSFYYLLQIQSPKEGIGAEWRVFESEDKLLSFVQTN